MGFNMSGSVVGKGECLQPRGVRPGACSPGKSFHFYRVYQKKFTVGKGLLMHKAFNAFNKILEF